MFMILLPVVRTVGGATRIATYSNKVGRYAGVMGWKTLKDAINKGIVWENGRADGFCRFSRYARKTPAFVET